MLPLNRWIASFVVVSAIAVTAVVLWSADGVPAVAAAEKVEVKAEVKAFAEYTDEGKLKQPVGYRKWPFIGTPVTPNDKNDGAAAFPEFHIVYIDPTSFEHYEKTGEFRDGCVIVKELTTVGDTSASSGKGYFMGEYSGLEVSIKDSKRFKDEPSNWAYFSFGHKIPLKETATKNAAASCSDCHSKNAKQDLVFTQYYPVLRAAAPKK